MKSPATPAGDTHSWWAGRQVRQGDRPAGSAGVSNEVVAATLSSKLLLGKAGEHGSGDYSEGRVRSDVINGPRHRRPDRHHSGLATLPGGVSDHHAEILFRRQAESVSRASTLGLRRARRGSAPYDIYSANALTRTNATRGLVWLDLHAAARVCLKSSGAFCTRSLTTALWSPMTVGRLRTTFLTRSMKAQIAASLSARTRREARTRGVPVHGLGAYLPGKLRASHCLRAPLDIPDSLAAHRWHGLRVDAQLRGSPSWRWDRDHGYVVYRDPRLSARRSARRSCTRRHSAGTWGRNLRWSVAS